jgi:hypothetical protein
MSTQVKSVLFSRTASELHQLIGQWNALQGVQWKVQSADHVGGSFHVDFARTDGVVDLAEAESWVSKALKHAAD